MASGAKSSSARQDFPRQRIAHELCRAASPRKISRRSAAASQGKRIKSSIAYLASRAPDLILLRARWWLLEFMWTSFWNGTYGDPKDLELMPNKMID
ncbi:hypothetical protein E2562_026770 [Oryza meyeriana var. granulata]|uniref:Uncharacterized protein n=1 Tax=Oryza meyeriana var. granulata TaxID=110450 RepID=A0A6G1C9G9_9ORYZ|nr:hypothetical protein E2562_026770 [Oryza meyeriana var. granulata]